MVVKGPDTALKPQTAGVGYLPVAADDGNCTMAQRDQRLDGAASRLPVIGGNTGQVFKGKGGGIVGHHHAGNVDGGKIPAEMIVDAAQEQNAQGLFLPAQLRRPGYLVGILVHVVHHQQVAGPGNQVLDGLHHLAEQLVTDALDHHQNRVGMGLLELLGVDVDFKIHLPGSLQNSGSGFFTDVGVVVQGAGDRADSIAGFGGKIFDCHTGPPFLVAWSLECGVRS